MKYDLIAKDRIVIDAGYDCILPELSEEQFNELEEKMKTTLEKLGKEFEKEYGIKIIDTDMPVLNVVDYEG